MTQPQKSWDGGNSKLIIPLPFSFKHALGKTMLRGCEGLSTVLQVGQGLSCSLHVKVCRCKAMRTTEKNTRRKKCCHGVSGKPCLSGFSERVQSYKQQAPSMTMIDHSAAKKAEFISTQRGLEGGPGFK